MKVEDIIEQVRLENQNTDMDEVNRISWNNCVDYVCDKLKDKLTK